MAKTYESIATYTVPSAQASYTFTSIPAIYTDLILVINAGGSTAGAVGCYMQFNGDTATNYSDTYILGTGSAATSGRDTSVDHASAGYPLYSTLTSTLITHIMNYTNTTTYKSSVNRGNDATFGTLAAVNLWRSTAAINAIKIYPASGNFLTGSTFTLYGIKAA
jgi:hypothetical protein